MWITRVPPFHRFSTAAFLVHTQTPHLNSSPGMKAYRGPSGEIRLFRPELNMARLNRSMARLSMPPIHDEVGWRRRRRRWRRRPSIFRPTRHPMPGALGSSLLQPTNQPTSPHPTPPQSLLECIRSLIKLDDRWIPSEPGTSLYIRPFAIATDVGLYLAKPTRTRVTVLTCPVGPYFPTTGFEPVALYACTNRVRAWPGGAGDAKVGGNYGPTIEVRGPRPNVKIRTQTRNRGRARGRARAEPDSEPEPEPEP